MIVYSNKYINMFFQHFIHRNWIPVLDSFSNSAIKDFRFLIIHFRVANKSLKCEASQITRMFKHYDIFNIF